ncbi:MAG: DUF4434 domain-containing protein [Limnochordaceae bacterium]|nr:DUF4434 domain-containing protein [Limnochordaceae bacterium]
MGGAQMLLGVKARGALKTLEVLRVRGAMGLRGLKALVGLTVVRLMVVGMTVVRLMVTGLTVVGLTAVGMSGVGMRDGTASMVGVAEAAGPSLAAGKPRFSGTFLQLDSVTAGWSAEEWDQEFASMKRVGMNLLIVQWAATPTSAYYHTADAAAQAGTVAAAVSAAVSATVAAAVSATSASTEPRSAPPSQPPAVSSSAPPSDYGPGATGICDHASVSSSESPSSESPSKPSSESPSEPSSVAASVRSPGPSPLDLIMRTAEKYGFSVFLGPYMNDAWWSHFLQESFVAQELAQTRRVAADLAKLYAHSPAFAGWYLPYEINATPAVLPAARRRAAELLKQAVQQFDELTPGRPVAISPFFDRWLPVGMFESWWKQVLTGSGVDIVFLQDGVGTGRKISPELAGRYFEAMRRAVNAANAAVVQATGTADAAAAGAVDAASAAGASTKVSSGNCDGGSRSSGGSDSSGGTGGSSSSDGSVGTGGSGRGSSTGSNSSTDSSSAGNNSSTDSSSAGSNGSTDSRSSAGNNSSTDSSSAGSGGGGRGGISLWSDLEIFVEGAWTPAPWDRVNAQIQAEAPHVDGFVVFEFNHYMSPVRSGASGPATQLYDAYETYLGLSPTPGLTL